MSARSSSLKPLFASLFAAASLLAAAPAARATITVYESRAAFLAAVAAPGVDSFDDLAQSSLIGPLLRYAGPYGYQVRLGSGATAFDAAGMPGDTWLRSGPSTDTLVFDGFTGGVAGLGGQIFSLALGPRAAGVSTTVTASDADGTLSLSFASNSASHFIGFVSSTGTLRSVTACTAQPGTTACGLAGSGGVAWAVVNDLTLAAAPAVAVPEPSAGWMALAGLGLVTLLAHRRRR